MEMPKYEKELYENFFNKGEEIIKKYPRKKENKYNIFSILKQEEKEEGCHSRIIFNLINDCESNKLEKRFLKLFFKEVLDEEFDEKKKYFVEREKNLGKYGRADLFIEDSDGKAYLIEMKINAGDQPKQLSRYNQYLKKNYKDDYQIYYLTLNGYHPSSYSLKGRAEVEYIIISFVDNIYNWIEKCIEEVGENNKILKINLEQYLETLTKITNRIGEAQKMDFIKMMKEGNNFRIAQEIVNNFEEIKQGIKEEFILELRERIVKKLNIEDIAKKKNLYEYINIIKFTEFYLYKEVLDIKNSLLTYGIGIDRGGFYFYIGLQDKKAEEWKIAKKDIKNKFNEITLEYNQETGTYFEYLEEEKFDISGDNFYILIDENRKEEREELINNLIEKFKEKYELINEYFPE